MEPVAGQHKSWHQYGINDGLPGNTVYDMLQDSRGLMWFVTDRGICRFNGYEFNSPVDTSVFAGAETFLPTEDIQGRIWFIRLDNSIWFVENDTIKAWLHNSLLKQILKSTSIIDQMGIDENGTVWLGVNNLGFLVFNRDGQHKMLRGSSHDNFSFLKIRNKVVYARQSRDVTVHPSVADFVELLNLEKESFYKIGQAKLRDIGKAMSSISIWPMDEGKFLLFADKSYFILHENNIIQSITSDIVSEKVIQTHQGELLMASHLNPFAGLHYFASWDHFNRGEGENLLTNFFVTDVFEDQNGSWWVTTKNSGVLYCKNPDIEWYDNPSGLPSEEVLTLTDDGKNTVFAGLPKSGIFKINYPGNEVKSLGKPDQKMELMALLFDHKRNQLWSSNPLSYFNYQTWQTVPLSNAKDISLSLSRDKLWMSSTFGFYSLDLKTNRVINHRMPDDPSTSMRTFNVAEDNDGRIWVSTVDGLRLWKTDHYELPPFDHDALKYPVRDIELLGDTSIAFAFRGGGILIRDKSGHLIHLTQQSGLCSDNISKLKAGNDGHLYACSNNGFDMLISISNGWKIKHFSKKQGLPSELVNDITVLDNQIWVATDKGLVRLKNTSISYPMPAPVLEKFVVNNQKVPYVDAIRLPFHQNDILFKFYSLDYMSEGEIIYRYRVENGDSTFQTTTSRVGYFPELAPGNYKFEVQALGDDGNWSKSSSWSFTILHPWWQKWWFLLAVLVALAVIMRVIIKSRLKAYREKTEDDIKIKELELAALRAQINPHFIFNCLGSIQHFIAENDKDAATRYLARFAKLVRLALHSSVDGKHSLSDEIHMLDHYLSLEQMRFKGIFDYSIKVDPDIDVDAISLPPMLVQPFVENAVIHGMKAKRDGGLIEITFSLNRNNLDVHVSDNGPGVDISITDRKSLGIGLTQRRLHLLVDHDPEITYQIENRSGAGGETAGTTVRLKIPLK